MATITSLPNETLTEIFQHAFLSSTAEKWNMDTLPSLRLVSSHWNALIEGLPELWTSVLVTDKSARRPGQSPFQSTHSRLLRSLTFPLQITIRMSSSTTLCKQDGRELGKIIAGVAHRVTSFKLRGGTHAVQTALLSRLDWSCMPILCSFSYVGNEDPVFGYTFSMRFKLGKPPLLMQRSINGMMDRALCEDEKEKIKRYVKVLGKSERW